MEGPARLDKAAAAAAPPLAAWLCAARPLQEVARAAPAVLVGAGEWAAAVAKGEGLAPGWRCAGVRSISLKRPSQRTRVARAATAARRSLAAPAEPAARVGPA